MGTLKRAFANNIRTDGKPLSLEPTTVTAHSPETDLQPIKSDLTALALREATNEASAAFNLPNQFIETFTDDTNLGTQTTGDRVSGYWATIYENYVRNIQIGSGRSNMVLDTGGWTGSYTNDRQRGGASGVYNDCYPDWLFDLSKDFRVRMFNTLDADGTLFETEWNCYNAIVTTDTSVAAGANPAIFRDQDNTINSYGSNTPIQWGDRVITAAYATTIGSDSYTDNYYNSSSGTVSLDCNSANAHFRKSAETSTREFFGVDVDYDKDNAQIVFRLATNTAFTTFESSDQVTMTEVPTTGRFMFGYGNSGNLGHNYSASITSTYAESDNTNFSWAMDSSASATGTLIQSANAVTGTRTKVGGTMLYKDESGTATLGSANDLAIYFTCDGGSNWTEAASYNAITPVYSTGIKQVRLGETTCTGGTDVRYKAVFANQSEGSKETQLHGIGINY
jgi:hypothetical protein